MENMMNQNDAINPNWNISERRSKIASSLRGILSGIGCDGNLKDVEIQALKAWLELQEQFGDVLDLNDAINNMISDGVIDDDEREELLELINDCIEYGQHSRDITEYINENLGFLRGITSDGEINRIEFNQLKEAIAASPDIWNMFPLSIVSTFIKNISNCDSQNADEIRFLFSKITSVTGFNFTDDGDPLGQPMKVFNDDMLDELPGKTVCFTGQFQSGPRSSLIKAANSIGVRASKTVTLDTDFLIIGSVDSPDWAFSSFGRKIERAELLKRDDRGIRICSEQKWNTIYNLTKENLSKSPGFYDGILSKNLRCMNLARKQGNELKRNVPFRYILNLNQG